MTIGMNGIKFQKIYICFRLLKVLLLSAFSIIIHEILPDTNGIRIILNTNGISLLVLHHHLKQEYSFSQLIKKNFCTPFWGTKKQKKKIKILFRIEKKTFE